MYDVAELVAQVGVKVGIGCPKSGAALDAEFKRGKWRIAGLAANCAAGRANTSDAARALALECIHMLRECASTLEAEIAE